MAGLVALRVNVGDEVGDVHEPVGAHAELLSGFKPRNVGACGVPVPVAVHVP